MIVISFVLVIVALILLIVGLVASTLGLVYASIAVSLVSAAFLAYGVVSRRGEDREPLAEGIGLGGATGAPEPALVGVGQGRGEPSEPTAQTATLSTSPDSTAPAAGSDDEGEWEETPLVLVVQGRPRYHLDGCRYIVGKDVEELELDEARAEGYTSCATCRPDEAIEAYFAEQEAERRGAVGLTDGTAAGPASGSAPFTDVVASEEQPLAVPAPPAKATAGSGKAAKPAAKPAGRPSTGRANAAPAKSARAAGTRTPAKAAPAAAPAKSANRSAAPPAPAGGVVIIPDRDKYHRPDCRFVRDAVDAERITKATARRRGMQACGVCKP